MGSSNSSLGSRSSRPRPHRFIKRKLRSFICGSSSSSSSSSHVPIPEVDEYEVKLLPRSAEWHDTLVVDRLQRSKKDCSSIICLENECSCSTTETRALSDRSCSASEAPSVECSSGCAEIVHVGKCMSKSKDSVAERLDIDYSANEPRLEIRGDICCSSSKGQCDIGCSSSGGHYSLHSEGVQVESSTDDVVRIGNSENVGGSEVCQERLCSSDMPCPELGDFCADGVLHSRNLTDSTMGVHNDESSSVPVVTDSSAMSVSTHGEITQVATPSPPGYLLQDTQQVSRNGSVLHVDVLSISSNVFFSSTDETNSRDMRRNSRRIFWDAFSRRGSRRHSDLQTIFLSSEDTDNLDSHDRWLLGFNDDTFEDMAGRDSGSLDSRSHNIYQGWRHSRSEIWERLRSGAEGSGQQARFCASGLHPYGTCSCEPYMMADDSVTHGSISRIVMLAEALFEVLDEIHRQPLSVSLSMVSLPAPESVVNSFPVKSHKKHSTAENGDEEQCYICLSEYEEGDEIRVLPCHHEYHMLCVDKWLKEIHGYSTHGSALFVAEMFVRVQLKDPFQTYEYTPPFI